MPSWRSGSAVGGEARGERWLVVSYWANVEGMVNSLALDERLPHLRARGIETEVITSICGPRPKAAPGLWHRVPSLSPSGFRYEVRYLLSRFPRGLRGPAKVVMTLLVL